MKRSNQPHRKRQRREMALLNHKRRNTEGWSVQKLKKQEKEIQVLEHRIMAPA